MFFRLSFAVLLFASASVTGQVKRDSSCFLINGQYVVGYGRATLTTALQPIHFGAKQWIAFGLVSGAGIFAYHYDQDLNDIVRRNLSKDQSEAFKITGNPFGNGLVIVPLLGGLYLHGYSTENPRSREAALHGMQAFVLGAGAAWALKHITKRPRPHQTEFPDANVWYGPSGYGGYDAFPSGHSLRSFAVATVLAGVYDDKPWVGILAFSLAGYSSISRLASGEHWLSDVFAGAALGYFVGRGVLMFNRSRYAGCVEPQLGENGIGLRIGLGGNNKRLTSTGK